MPWCLVASHSWRAHANAAKMTTIHVVGAAIVDGCRCLIAQRGPGQKLPGKWEFPGGKIEPGESPQVALAREIHEELGLTILVGELLGSAEAKAAFGRIALDVYAATIVHGPLQVREHACVRWVTEDELVHYDWADADVPLVAPVAACLRARSEGQA